MKTLNNKNNKSLTNEDTFNYDITKTNSATDCTGLIPTPPQSESEFDSYMDVYEIRPSVPPEK